MKTIHKAQLEVTDWQEIMLPADAKILTAQHQENQGICIWYETDTSTHHHVQTAEFAVFGTGHDMGRKWMHDREPIYLGTCFFQNDKLVFHVYHLKPKTYWEETHDQ